MTAPLLLGLTGGIGSGKSTVAARLALHGAAVMDADAISRATTAANGSAIGAIAEAFGPEMIAPDGALDRDAMRQLVYRDPDARRRLEAIIHPLVAEETDRQADAAARAGSRLIVFDVPLLVESGARWRARVDRVLVVDCEPETQVQRVQARSKLHREQIEAIIAAQCPREARLAAADVIVHNGHAVPLAQLHGQLDQWFAGLGI